MKALITGVSGFVGTHLCELLLKNDYEVFGLSRSFPKNKDIHFTPCDINDAVSLENILNDIRPDEIYHLAGTAYIPSSFEKPIEAYQTIVNGTLTLYETIRDLNLKTKILFVGSAEVYGEGQGVPFSEGNALHPTNPYAGAKACADIISEQYAKSYELNIIRVRPFNHTGPHQSSNFVCSSFAMQIAELEQTGNRKIQVGNIDVRRDFLDVRDVVRAYALLMKNGVSGDVYNVSSKEALPISELLNYLLLSSNLTDWEIEVDPSKVRGNDVVIRIGDNSKLIHETGWRPEYKLQDTMNDLLDYWRNCR